MITYFDLPPLPPQYLQKELNEVEGKRKAADDLMKAAKQFRTQSEEDNTK